MEAFLRREPNLLFLRGQVTGISNADSGSGLQDLGFQRYLPRGAFGDRQF